MLPIARLASPSQGERKCVQEWNDHCDIRRQRHAISNICACPAELCSLVLSEYYRTRRKIYKFGKYPELIILQVSPSDLVHVQGLQLYSPFILFPQPLACFSRSCCGIRQGLYVKIESLSLELPWLQPQQTAKLRAPGAAVRTCTALELLARTLGPTRIHSRPLPCPLNSHCSALFLL